MFVFPIGFNHLYIPPDPWSTAGYFAGGNSLSSIEKFAYPTETPSSETAVLSQSVYFTAGSSYATKGYVGGGYALNLNKIHSFLYSSKTCSVIGAILYRARRWLSGAYSPSKGYFIGGSSDLYGSGDNLIDGSIFSTDTAFTANGVLAVALYAIGTSSSDTKFVAVGGTTDNTPKNYCQSMSFSDESVTNLGAILTYSRFRMCGITNGSRTIGYYFMGNGTQDTSIFSHNYSTGTMVNLSTMSTKTGVDAVGVIGSNVSAYYSGATTSYEKFTFSTETISNPNKNVIVSRTSSPATFQY